MSFQFTISCLIQILKSLPTLMQIRYSLTTYLLIKVVLATILFTPTSAQARAYIQDEKPPATREVQSQPAVWKPSVVLHWNEVALAAIRNGEPHPTVVTRQLFMLHKAMYDSWAMYDAVALPTTLDLRYRRPLSQHTAMNKSTAVSQAAYLMLVHFFPEYETETGAFSRLLTQLGHESISRDYGITPDDEILPGWIGFLAAQAILADHLHDGSLVIAVINQ